MEDCSIFDPTSGLHKNLCVGLFAEQGGQALSFLRVQILQLVHKDTQTSLRVACVKKIGVKGCVLQAAEPLFRASRYKMFECVLCLLQDMVDKPCPTPDCGSFISCILIQKPDKRPVREVLSGMGIGNETDFPPGGWGLSAGKQIWAYNRRRSTYYPRTFGVRSHVVVARLSHCNCEHSGWLLFSWAVISAERSDSYTILCHVLTKKKANGLTVLKDSLCLSLKVSIVEQSSTTAAVPISESRSGHQLR